MESSNLSRRMFLGLGATAGLAAGAGLLGCAPKSAGSSDTTSISTAEIEWDKEVDVVVCGFGGAGAAAAIEATKAGAKTVVLEKSTAGGGATALSGGFALLGGGTALQKACGIEESPENFRAYFELALGTSRNQKLVDVYCEQAVEAYDWLVEQGVVYNEKADDTAPFVIPILDASLAYSGNKYAAEYSSVATPTPHGHVPVRKEGEAGGKPFFEPIGASAQASGAEFVFSAEAKQLVTDDSGRVIGVMALVSGKETYYKAGKGVVLATGAFTMNEEMVADYCPEMLLGAKVASPEDMGTGIKMGMAVGADLRSMNRFDPSLSPYMFGEALAQGILVGHRGLRFISEDNYYRWVGVEIFSHEPETAYVILDESMRAQLANEGSMEIAASADTVEALAPLINMDPDALKHSVERYNSLCENGIDSDYHKQERFLKPIAQAPYHAVFFGAALGGSLTLGGLKINENTQVINTSGAVIPGLYAAGRTSCGVFGEYAGSGTSIGDAIIFGRIAGQNAAAAE